MKNGLNPENLVFVPTKRSFHFIWSCLVIIVIIGLFLFLGAVISQ